MSEHPWPLMIMVKKNRMDRSLYLLFTHGSLGSDWLICIMCLVPINGRLVSVHECSRVTSLRVQGRVLGAIPHNRSSTKHLHC